MGLLDILKKLSLKPNSQLFGFSEVVALEVIEKSPDKHKYSNEAIDDIRAAKVQFAMDPSNGDFYCIDWKENTAYPIEKYKPNA